MTEQEARDALGTWMPELFVWDQARYSECVDQYRAAVRAETLREVRGVVEGMRKNTEVGIIPKFGSFPVCKTCHIASMHFDHEGHDCDTHNATLDLTLAALDALAHPEGK